MANYKNILIEENKNMENKEKLGSWRVAILSSAITVAGY